MWSKQLAGRPGALRREFEAAQASPSRRVFDDGLYDIEVILGNGHVWRQQGGNGRWCRFSSDPRCFIFGDGPCGGIEVFRPHAGLAGSWSGMQKDPEFTPNDPVALAPRRLPDDAGPGPETGWLLPNGRPDVSRAHAFRRDPADPLIWRHVEGDNVIQLAPSRYTRLPEHVGGFSE